MKRYLYAYTDMKLHNISIRKLLENKLNQHFFLLTGRVAEFDTPAKLLEREDSFFSKLIKEYSMRSKTFNSF